MSQSPELSDLDKIPYAAVLEERSKDAEYPHFSRRDFPKGPSTLSRISGDVLARTAAYGIAGILIGAGLIFETGHHLSQAIRTIRNIRTDRVDL